MQPPSRQLSQRDPGDAVMDDHLHDVDDNSTDSEVRATFTTALSGITLALEQALTDLNDDDGLGATSASERWSTTVHTLLTAILRTTTSVKDSPFVGDSTLVRQVRERITSVHRQVGATWILDSLASHAFHPTHTSSAADITAAVAAAMQPFVQRVNRRLASLEAKARTPHADNSTRPGATAPTPALTSTTLLTSPVPSGSYVAAAAAPSATLPSSRPKKPFASIQDVLDAPVEANEPPSASSNSVSKVSDEGQAGSVNLKREEHAPTPIPDALLDVNMEGELFDSDGENKAEIDRQLKEEEDVQFVNTSRRELVPERLGGRTRSRTTVRAKQIVHKVAREHQLMQPMPTLCDRLSPDYLPARPMPLSARLADLEPVNRLVDHAPLPMSAKDQSIGKRGRNAVDFLPQIAVRSLAPKFSGAASSNKVARSSSNADAASSSRAARSGTKARKDANAPSSMVPLWCDRYSMVSPTLMWERRSCVENNGLWSYANGSNGLVQLPFQL